MKNMKISAKLITGFLCVAVFATAVGLAGVFGMIRMDHITTEMYESQTVPLSYLSRITETLQRLRVGMREYVIGVAVDDMGKIDSSYTTINSMLKEMDENFALYSSTLVDPEAIRLFNEAEKLYSGTYKNYLEQSYRLAKAMDFEACYDVLSQAKADTDTIVDNISRVMDIRITAASENSDGAAESALSLLLIVVALLVICVAVAVFLAFYISGLIGKPMKALTDFMVKAGSIGDINLGEEDTRIISAYSQIKDEVGVCISSCAKFIGHLLDMDKAMGAMADGDLTIDVKLLSDKDTMGNSLNRVLENLNSMFSDINIASDQVSSGASQVSMGSQSLAQGSTEQASSVEQLSASISEISTQTAQNTTLAKDAADMSNRIKINVEKGNNQMNHLMGAMTEINQASQSISKVIKVIDDIAFQTNILALNAAVEAARAGQHGKGFAVVAEEVRNLASKSAEAAKDTSGMIANSIDKADMGLAIATETSESLNRIVEEITKSVEIVNDIAVSSEEQTDAISQINIGIEQVSQVIQQNSATAQESAAASEEMSGQANILKNLIARFKLRGGRSGVNQISLSDSFGTNGSYTPTPGLPASGGASASEFGKY